MSNLSLINDYKTFTWEQERERQAIRLPPPLPALADVEQPFGLASLSSKSKRKAKQLFSAAWFRQHKVAVDDGLAWAACAAAWEAETDKARWAYSCFDSRTLYGTGLTGLELIRMGLKGMGWANQIGVGWNGMGLYDMHWNGLGGNGLAWTTDNGAAWNGMDWDTLEWNVWKWNGIGESLWDGLEWNWLSWNVLE